MGKGPANQLLIRLVFVALVSASTLKFELFSEAVYGLS